MSEFNPLDVSHLEDPYPALAELRETCPVHDPMPGFHLITRRTDVAATFRDHEHFSNDWHGAGGLLGGDETPPEKYTVQEMDPPRHSPVRRLLLTALAPGKVAEAEPLVRSVADRLVNAMVSERVVDLVARLAVQLPSEVITHMIGVPSKDHPLFRDWTDQIVNSADPLNPDVGRDEVQQITERFDTYILDLIEQRRGESGPTDDLVTRMIQYRDDEGHQFNDVEIATQVRFLIMAGNETTTHLIGNLFYELGRRPELYQRLRTDRDDIPKLVEESLRHRSPVQIMFRSCLQGAAAAGVEFKDGEIAALSIASANRDPEFYDDPDDFDIGRDNVSVHHLAFGQGLHMCVGAPLARLEARVAIEAFMDRVPSFGIRDGYEYERVKFFFMRGPSHLPIELLGAESQGARSCADTRQSM